MRCSNMTMKINYQEDEEGEEGHETEGSTRKTSESYSKQSRQTRDWMWIVLFIVAVCSFANAF